MENEESVTSLAERCQRAGYIIKTAAEGRTLQNDNQLMQAIDGLQRVLTSTKEWVSPNQRRIGVPPDDAILSIFGSFRFRSHGREKFNVTLYGHWGDKTEKVDDTQQKKQSALSLRTRWVLQEAEERD